MRSDSEESEAEETENSQSADSKSDEEESSYSENKEEASSASEDDDERVLKSVRKLVPRNLVERLGALLSRPHRRRYRSPDTSAEEASEQSTVNSHTATDTEDNSEAESLEGTQNSLHRYDHKRELADYYSLYPKNLNKRKPDWTSDEAGFTSDVTANLGQSIAVQESEDEGMPTRGIFVKARCKRLRHIRVQVGTKLYRGLLDNGSTSTFVTPQLVKEQALTPTPSSRPMTFGLDSSPAGRADQEVRLVIQMVTTRPERLIIDTPAYIMKNLGSDILIGRNLLCSSGLNIDTTSGRPIREDRINIPNYLADLNAESEPPIRIEIHNKEAYITVPLGEGTVCIGASL